jgi:hypothetical protein
LPKDASGSSEGPSMAPKWPFALGRGSIGPIGALQGRHVIFV